MSFFFNTGIEFFQYRILRAGDDPVGWNVRESSSCGRGVVRWKDLLEQVDARAPREYDHEGSY